MQVSKLTDEEAFAETVCLEHELEAALLAALPPGIDVGEAKQETARICEKFIEDNAARFMSVKLALYSDPVEYIGIDGLFVTPDGLYSEYLNPDAYHDHDH